MLFRSINKLKKSAKRATPVYVVSHADDENFLRAEGPPEHRTSCALYRASPRVGNAAKESKTVQPGLFEAARPTMQLVESNQDPLQSLTTSWGRAADGAGKSGIEGDSTLAVVSRRLPSEIPGRRLERLTCGL